MRYACSQDYLPPFLPKDGKRYNNGRFDGQVKNVRSSGDASYVRPIINRRT